jgi:nitroreductase
MNLDDAIRTTRAVRRFTDEPVTVAEILHCLEAANRGPSGGNIQPWQFLVVTDPAAKTAVGDVYRRAYERYEPALVASLPPFRSQDDEHSFNRSLRASRHLAEHLSEAPALVFVLMPGISMTLRDDGGELDVGTPYASVYPAVQNLLLAARGLGIGTTLTTVYRINQAELRDLLEIPDRFEVVALVPMGRPRGSFSEPRRRPVAKVTHWNRYGMRRG